MERLVYNSYGDEREVKPPTSYPDKKKRVLDYNASTHVLIEAQKVLQSADMSQMEAIWDIKSEYPMLPFAILCATDIHYGSTRANYPVLNKHLDMVENTPNFGMVTNGDHVDNFTAVFHPTGMTENPLPPQIQSRMLAERLKKLDDKSKIGVLSYGNHDTSIEMGGADWYDSFLSEFHCPVFAAGGLLHILNNEEEYQMALSHTYWGRSKLNPTNAAKRLVEYEYPTADISFLGHTHQSTYEHFDRGGKDVVAVIGGTYKDEDKWAKRMGIGGRGGKPGMTLMLWPNEHRMQMFKDIDTASIIMQALIGEYKHSISYPA